MTQPSLVRVLTIKDMLMSLINDGLLNYWMIMWMILELHLPSSNQTWRWTFDYQRANGVDFWVTLQ